MSEVAKLKKEVAQLTATLGRMSQLSVSGAKSKKKAKKSKQNSSSLAVTGRITLSKCAPILTVTLPKDSSLKVLTVDVEPSKIAGMTKLSDQFERSRWEKLSVYYKPMVGTTTGGGVTIGVDWDHSQAVTTRVAVSGYTPAQTLPVWQDGERQKMVLPKSRLNTKLWYTHALNGSAPNDKGPCTIVVGVEAGKASQDQVLGEIWVDATVTFDGLQA